MNLERQAADVISAVTGAKIKYSRKEDKVDMCLAVEEIEIEGVIRAFRKFNIPQEGSYSTLWKSTIGVRKKPKS